MVWYGMVWYGMVWYGMVWYGNSLFDIAEKYIVIAKYLIKYMIYVWRLHKEYIGCSLPCSHQGNSEIYCII